MNTATVSASLMECTGGSSIAAASGAMWVDKKSRHICEAHKSSYLKMDLWIICYGNVSMYRKLQLWLHVYVEMYDSVISQSTKEGRFFKTLHWAQGKPNTSIDCRKKRNACSLFRLRPRRSLDPMHLRPSKLARGIYKVSSILNNS